MVHSQLGACTCVFSFYNALTMVLSSQAKTQGLNITEQLNAGIRFIDFRVVYTSAPNASSGAPHDWYCLHMVQSNQPGSSACGSRMLANV